MYDATPSFEIKLDHVRWGEFSVSTQKNPLSQVVFVQSAVNLMAGSDGALVKALCPVRESLSQQMLGFENLVQRDLDDARVANSLIPYLLDENNPVRMFPSILVLVLPKGLHGEPPPRLYLPRQESPHPEAVGGGFERVVMPFGDGDAKHAFTFARLRLPGGSFVPYGARLEINPQLCHLAIVDGQHRAMALLALWRNLNGWPDSGKPFRHFYANHPAAELRKRDLSGISLPVTLCFFPQLHQANDQADADGFDTIKAARRLFLDVNRSAKPPSKAREVLLDDRRVTSEFVRQIMTEIKGDGGSLELWNLFYDEAEANRSSLPKLAVTSVLHLQYALRMLLLGKEGRQGKVLLSNDFGTYKPAGQDNNRMLRWMLDWHQAFGDEAGTWKDDTVPAAKRSDVVKGFMARWGGTLLYALDALPAFQALASASRRTKQQLDAADAPEDRLVSRMLFEGQGVRMVHDQICVTVKDKKHDTSPHPYPKETQGVFTKQHDRAERLEREAEAVAARVFWTNDVNGEWPKWLSADDKDALVKRYARDLMRAFRTKAFQVALLMTLGQLERDLSATLRGVFWEQRLDKALLDELYEHFTPPPLPRRQSEANAANRVQRILTEERAVAWTERGLQPHVRRVAKVQLNDGRWQFFKFQFFELFNSRSVKDRVAAWSERYADAIAADEVELDDLAEVAESLNGTLCNAVEAYRVKLLVLALDSSRTDYKAKYGHEPTSDDWDQFWTLAKQDMGAALEFTVGDTSDLEPLRPQVERLTGLSGAESTDDGEDEDAESDGE